MENGFRIEPGKPEHTAALPAIERATVNFFPEGMMLDTIKDYMLFNHSQNQRLVTCSEELREPRQ